ncbi:MAG TPA: DUF885 domain-containing protein [Rhizomicrobium sp.]|jgi:uncharacterized protein (DUF885 family)
MTAIDTFADDLLLRMLTLRPDLAAEMGVTTVGNHRLPQDMLPDFSDAGGAAADAMMADASERLKQIARPSSGEDAITHRVVRYVLEDGAFSFFRGRSGHRFVDTPYPVNHLSGFHPILVLMLSRDHGIRTPDDAEAYLARLAQIPRACAGVEDALESRAARGIVAPRFTLLASAADMRSFAVDPPAQNVLVTSLAAKLHDARIPNSETFVARAARLLELEIVPAYTRIVALIEELAAGAGEERGFWSLPDGAAHYEWLFRASTTSNLSPDEANGIGRAEVAHVQATIRDRFAALGIHGEDIAALYAQISDAPSYRYARGGTGRAAVWSDANTLMRRFESATLDLFNTRPRAALDLVEIPATLEDTMHTHYTPPAADGSRPGRFSLNIALAQGNPRWELATLCAHEGTPGHHLQLAIAQELPIASVFRRTVVFDAYIEGWAKYAETIPETHGLLDDPHAQLGRLRGELYSTVNLVLDTGVHTMGWSRDQARTFFRDNTGVSEDFAGVIADRSFVTPGQLCSYKVGMMKFLAAHDRFRGRDVRDFHDCVLGHGALPLSVLDDVVTATLSGSLS